MQARETACKVITALRKILRRIETALLLLALLFTASTAWDMYTFTDAGRSSDGFPGFEALRKRNTDIAGWIRMDGTHIDYPVLRGKDKAGSRACRRTFRQTRFCRSVRLS
jgi:sortase B